MSEGKTDACCKVGRNIEKYDLGAFDEELRREHRRGESLRSLERFVNQEILKMTLTRAGADIVADSETVYEFLTDEETSVGRRIEMRNKLEAEGVDVEELQSDFVSYQTIRHHLGNCLDIDTNRQPDIDVDDAMRTIQWAMSRTEAIVERTFERLQNAGKLDVSDLEVAHTIRVRCGECGQGYRPMALLRRGRCECSDETGTPENP